MKVSTVVLLAACGLLAGCERTPLVLEPHSAAPTNLTAASLASEAVKPNFNLEVMRRGPDGSDGVGHVKFRQANDDPTIVDLGVWVRDLAPNTHYKLQRAVDTVLDDDCTSTSWLTLGAGSVPPAAVVDDGVTGRVCLIRRLSY